MKAYSMANDIEAFYLVQWLKPDKYPIYDLKHLVVGPLDYLPTNDRLDECEKLDSQTIMVEWEDNE